MKRSEIWLISLDPTQGAEIKKTRPAVIISSDKLKKLPLSIIVPITHWKEQYSIAPWMIKLIPTSQNGLAKNSSADCFQVRSVSQTRFIKKIGQLLSELMEEILSGICSVMEIR